MRWQILIPHMPHRHKQLCTLLKALDKQMEPDEVQVVVFTDNLELPYREKLQTLYDHATADYVSSLGNDDMVAPDFIDSCLIAMDFDPDYVGFKVRYTEGGVPQLPVWHSLECGAWWADGNGIYRDLMYYNPIRRDLADQVRFRGDYCDEEWAADLRALGVVQNEVFIDDEMVYYQRNPADNFHTNRVPMDEDRIPALPQYEWVKHLMYQRA